MSGSAEETKKHIETYKKVGGSLAVLTVLTVLASYLDIGVALGIILALIIATTKGSLVVSFFMHLIHERSPWIVFTLGLTVVFWTVLMFVPLLVHSDTFGVHRTLPNANAPAHAEEAH